MCANQNALRPDRPVSWKINFVEFEVVEITYKILSAFALMLYQNTLVVLLFAWIT